MRLKKLKRSKCVELVEQSSTVRTGTKSKKGAE